jgi:hypothetical protein
MDEVPKIVSNLLEYIDFNQQSLWSEPQLDTISRPNTNLAQQYLRPQLHSIQLSGSMFVVFDS